MQIHIARNGQQLGPYSLEQIQGLLVSGAVQSTDLGWHEGLANWLPLSEIPGCKPEAVPAHPAFSAAPPPYCAPRPILATVISIFYFVAAPFGLLSLVFMSLMGSITLPGQDGAQAYYRSFTGLDFGLGILMAVANLAGALFLFRMRRHALYCFGFAVVLKVIYEARLLSKPLPIPAKMPYGPMSQFMQSSMQTAVIGGALFAIGLGCALLYYLWHLTRTAQLR